MPPKQRVRDHAIHLASYRRKLPARPKDPYKKMLGGSRTGQWIGYLKGESGSESWCACWRGDDGKERQEWVGNALEMPFEEARDAVVEVLVHVGRGGIRKATVWDACESYMTHFADQRRSRGRKGERAVKVNQWKMSHYIRTRSIASIQLAKLRLHDLEVWQRSLVTDTCKEATVNRVTRALKAALNHAHYRQLVASDEAWRRFKGYPGAARARQIFLTSEHRKNFLNTCSPDLRDFCTALFYTGARVGELRAAKVSDLDLKRGTLRLLDYKGKQEMGFRERFLPLNMFGPEVLEFFRRATQDKLPSAYLFTRESGLSWDETENASNYFNNRFNHFKRKVRGLPKENHRLTKAILEKAEGKFPAAAVPYDFRHTAISEWLSAGMLPSDVAYCAGTSITEIDKHYRKFIPSTVQGKLVSVKVI